MNKIHIEYITNVFGCTNDDVIIISRLFGGKSNKTYLFSINDNKFTFRIPGKNASVFVNRNNELSNIENIITLNISNNIVHFNSDNGYMIAEYVSGKDLSETQFNYKDIANHLKKLHCNNKLFKNNYAPFERLKKYENLLGNLESSIKKEYNLLKDKLLLYKDFLINQKTCMCHNDFQPANIIKTNDDNILLIDWEFSGNNNPIYDIACFGTLNIANAEELLKYYFNSPTSNDFKTLYLWRAFQALQWFNVATYKHSIGLSKELNVNFELVADNYLILAKQMLLKI